jgi:hypothetical protein
MLVARYRLICSSKALASALPTYSNFAIILQLLAIPFYLKLESFVEYWIERFPVYFCLLLPFPLWQEVDFDIGI